MKKMGITERLGKRAIPKWKRKAQAKARAKRRQKRRLKRKLGLI